MSSLEKSINIRPLNEVLRKVATETLREVESRIPADISALKEWIHQQPHLKACTDDQYLLTFLRGSKHSLEIAKSKIEYFYTLKTMVPEAFKNHRMDQKTCDLIRTGISTFSYLPSGALLSIKRFNNFDQSKYRLIDFIRLRMMLMEYGMHKLDSFIVGSYVEIFDLSKIPLGLYTQVDFAMLKKFRIFTEKGCPVRYKAVHVINCPKELLNIVMYLTKFVPDKYKNRIFVHKTLEDLYKHIPKECLPAEYGGTNGTIAENALRIERDMIACEHIFIEDDQYGVDESLRADEHFNNQRSLFGLEGSFRQLDID